MVTESWCLRQHVEEKSTLSVWKRYAVGDDGILESLWIRLSVTH